MWHPARLSYMVLTPTKPYCYAVLTAHITYLWHAPTVSLDPLDRAYGANNTLVISLRFYPGSLPGLPFRVRTHSRRACLAGVERVHTEYWNV